MQNKANENQALKTLMKTNKIIYKTYTIRYLLTNIICIIMITKLQTMQI